MTVLLDGVRVWRGEVDGGSSEVITDSVDIELEEGSIVEFLNDSMGTQTNDANTLLVQIESR